MNSPIGEAHRSTLKCDVSISSRVTHLGAAINPSTVFGRVSEIVVNTVYLSADRARPHIGKELRKVIPALADCDASPSVVGEVRVFRITAPIPHSSPNRMFSGAFTISGRSVFSDGLKPQTPTALCVSSCEITARNKRFGPAFASAAPDHETTPAAPLFGCSNNREASKLQSGEFPHKDIRLFYNCLQIETQLETESICA